MRGITKRFPGVLANDNISLDLRKREIHALLGENGAGKSTLMNILYGLYQPDSGEIFLNGQSVKISNPRTAIDHGIGMVHQHFMLVPTLSVVENVTLGREEGGAFMNLRAPADRIRAISAQYGIAVDPTALVSDLSVGQQQRVEIIKTLYRNADVLVLDEPTAVLTPIEVDELFVTLRSLVAQGKSIVFITHKLREVLALANRITVLRQGRVVGHTTPGEADTARLASMMVGRSVILKVDKKPVSIGEDVEPVLAVRDLHVLSERGTMAVDHVSFAVRPGEIVGIAGVEGNGQSELVDAITGLRKREGGIVLVGGVQMTNQVPIDVIRKGGAHVPEDRHKYGLVLPFAISHNLILSTFSDPPYTSGVSLDEPAIDEHARELITRFDVRTPGEHTRASALSGGNQQKVVVAREFSRPNKLLVAAQPTRGVDVGSIEFIHNQIVAQRDSGVGVLLVSAELDEIMALSDRIFVMFKGKLVGEMAAADATREQVGLWMMGSTANKQVA